MRRVIFYFTGSGNSLIIAKKVAQKLDECELLSVVEQVKSGEKIVADEVGLVFPVYMHRAPKIVIQLLKQLESSSYIFVIANNGGQMGFALQQVRRKIRSKGLELHAGFDFPMPDNYTPFGPPPEKEMQDELFAACDEKIGQVVACVNKHGNHWDDSTSFFKKYIWPAPFYALGYAMLHTLDSGFHTSEQCNGCGVCEKVCPVGNIVMRDGKPTWKGHCEQCFACHHWCPSAVLEYGKKSVGIARYRHPDVTLQDMFQQAGEF